MNPLKPFAGYVSMGIARKVSRDIQRAKSLLIESERKMSSLKEKIDKLGVKDENANDYVEYCYDILMFLIRAKMLSEGYSSSGQGAHESEVAFMGQLGFGENEIDFTDHLRYFRNRILYYGTRLDKEYAEKVVEFTKKAYPKLKERFKQPLIVKDTKI